MSLVELGKRLLDAAKLGETDQVRMLMTNGAPFSADWLGTSPLHIAAQYGHVETVEVLLRGGISRDAKTKVDRTPLHVAAQEGHFDVVELLIDHGAEVDARDLLRMTPLHWAVEHCHYRVAKFLLQCKADPSALSKFDKTPLDIAVYNNDTRLIHLLTKEVITPIQVKKYRPLQSPTRLVNLTEADIITASGSLPIFIQSESISSSKPRNQTLTGTVKTLPLKIQSPLRTVYTSPVSKSGTAIPLKNQSHLRTMYSSPSVATIPIKIESVSSAGQLSQGGNATSTVTKTASVTKPVVLRATAASSQKSSATRASAKRQHSCDSEEEGELNDSSSTNVLATLAALAEATAPNSSLSQSEALHWLEMNGITMLPPDNSTIVASALEGGQTVSLTEAGKLTLTWAKEHENLNSDLMDISSSISESVDDPPVTRTPSHKVITIVTDQSHIPAVTSSPHTPIVVLNSSQVLDANSVQSSAKKIRRNITIKEDLKIVANGDSLKSSDEDEKLKLKKELEMMKREAELYKAQLLAKEFEAEKYKKQLEKMRMQPSEVD